VVIDVIVVGLENIQCPIFRLQVKKSCSFYQFFNVVVDIVVVDVIDDKAGVEVRVLVVIVPLVGLQSLKFQQFEKNYKRLYFTNSLMLS
jgi:hypothetical protein